MNAYSIRFPGSVLDRGFWLYVIDVCGPESRHLYVGRTGDSSSPNAGSPFSRIGQHLDRRVNAKGNALARNLRVAGIDIRDCDVEMIAIGPLFPEAPDFEAHRPIRDRMAALERALASGLRDRGYKVLGKHGGSKEVDAEQLGSILALIEARLGKGV